MISASSEVILTEANVSEHLFFRCAKVIRLNKVFVQESIWQRRGQSACDGSWNLCLTAWGNDRQYTASCGTYCKRIIESSEQTASIIPMSIFSVANEFLRIVVERVFCAGPFRRIVIDLFNMYISVSHTLALVVHNSQPEFLLSPT